MSQGDIEERVLFYNEMIDDGIEEGLTEEEAVEKLGAVEDIISQIKAENQQEKTEDNQTEESLVKDNNQTHRRQHI